MGNYQRHHESELDPDRSIGVTRRVTPATQGFTGPAEKRRLWIEVGVVLMLAAVPDLVAALSSLAMYAGNAGYEGMEYPFGGQVAQLVARSLQVSAPILYIVWRSGEGFASIGLCRPRWIIDAASGFAAFIMYYLAYFMLAWAAWLFMLAFGTEEVAEAASGGEGPPIGAAGLLLALLMSVANAFAEELAMRGYLLPRLERLLGSTMWALALSTAVFASYHVYQGVYGLVSATAFGLVAGGVFVLTRRLWPAFLMHFLGDLVPSVVAMIDGSW